jgi:MFS family permease
VAVTVLLVRLVDEWASFLPAATFDSFRADLGLTYRGAALALLAIGPGAIVGSAVTVLADTRSRRVLAAGGALVYAAALALFAAATSSWMLVVGGVGVGLGATLLVDTVEVALADLCPDTDALERALARMNVAAGVGDLTGPLLVAGAAALGWSWRVPLVITAAATAAYGVLIACTPLPAPRSPELVGPDVAPPHPARDVLMLLRRTELWWAGACGALLVGLDESFIAFVIAYLRRDDGTSDAAATLIAAVFVIGGLFAAVRLARGERGARGARGARAGNFRGALRAAAITMVAGAVALATVPSPGVVAISGFAIGAGTIAFWVPFHAAMLRLVPGRAASVSAVVGTIEMTGLAIAPLIGAVSDAWGLHAGLVVYALLPIALAVLAGVTPAVLERCG